LRFGLSSPVSALKNASGGKCLSEEAYVLRDIAVNAALPIYPDVFEGQCMAPRPCRRHIDSEASHAIHPTQTGLFHECKRFADGRHGAK
jgi:hypothetical protein